MNSMCIKRSKWKNEKNLILRFFFEIKQFFVQFNKNIKFKSLFLNKKIVKLKMVFEIFNQFPRLV